jgi:hypothetical protein
MNHRTTAAVAAEPGRRVVSKTGTAAAEGLVRRTRRDVTAHWDRRIEQKWPQEDDDRPGGLSATQTAVLEAMESLGAYGDGRATARDVGQRTGQPMNAAAATLRSLLHRDLAEKAGPYGSRWGYRLTFTGREKVRQTRQQRETARRRSRDILAERREHETGDST